MDPTKIGELASLPWHIQLVLGAGYCAYLTAYVGLRHNHKTADVVFASLSFGLVAGALLIASEGWPWQAQAALAVSGALAAGIIWRTLCRLPLRKLLRKLNYSWSDDTPSAWDCLQENSRHPPTQLTVELDDGRYLLCSSTARVKNLPFGPYTLGTNGDLLMYVDRSIDADGNVRDVDGVFDGDWGDLVTYVPKDRIRKIAMRHK